MKNPLVSICIPVYNCEKYVKDCILSAVNQTYENIEVLIRDDGSTDNSKNILKEFEKHDKVRVLYGENVGLGSSRKILWKESKGEYIFHLDSDDMISESCISDIVVLAIKHSADYVRVHATRDEKELGKETDFFDKSIIIQNSDEMKRSFLLNDSATSSFSLEHFWGVLLKKTSFDVSMVTDGVQAEDGARLFKFWTKKTDNVYIHYKFPAIYFRLVSTSLSNDKDIKRIKDICGQFAKGPFFFIDNLSLFTEKEKCRVATSLVKLGIARFCFLWTKNNDEVLVKLLKDYFKTIPNYKIEFMEALCLFAFNSSLGRRLLLTIWHMRYKIKYRK